MLVWLTDRPAPVSNAVLGRVWRLVAVSCSVAEAQLGVGVGVEGTGYCGGKRKWLAARIGPRGSDDGPSQPSQRPCRLRPTPRQTREPRRPTPSSVCGVETDNQACRLVPHPPRRVQCARALCSLACPTQEDSGHQRPVPSSSICRPDGQASAAAPGIVEVGAHGRAGTRALSRLN